MPDYQKLSYEYETKAVEEIQKANPDNGYYPYLQKGLEYAREATKYAELELEDSGYEIINDFFLMNVIDYAEEVANVLDDRALRDYPPYQECEMYKVNLKYRKDIVDILAFASQVYEKHIPRTEVEQYTKHKLMYHITNLCYNYWVYFDNGSSEFIGLNSIEKRPYLQLFDKLKMEGIHEIEFNRYMYFHKNTLSIERETVDEFRSKELAKVNQMRQSSQGGCYIATAVYGSYDCPEVWTLRRFRDDWLSSRILGRLFVKIYYKISPAIVKIFGKRKLFNLFWRSILDKFTSFLNTNGYSSEKYNDK